MKMTCGVMIIVMIIALVSLTTSRHFWLKVLQCGLHALLEAHSWLN